MLADRHIAEGLRAAAQVIDAISTWNAETLEGLGRGRVTMRARALTGDQVTDDRTLAAAKLAGLHIEVPPVAYREMFDAYAAAAGRPTARAGVLEPTLEASLRRPGEGDAPRLERV